MKIKSLAPLYVLVLSLTLQACGGSGAGILPEPEPIGSGTTDGTTDGGTTDGTTDGGTTDGGTTDGGTTDGGTTDGSADGGATDGSADGGSTDGGSTDGGSATAGVEMIEGFGGAVFDEAASSYTFPAGSEVWAGFANLNVDIYPFTFANGGSITFTAAVAAGGADTNVYFRFERLPFPDVDPSINLDPVLIVGETELEYTITIPAQDAANTYESFLLYVVEQDQTVIIKNIVVNDDGGSSDDASGTTDGSADGGATDGSTDGGATDGSTDGGTTDGSTDGGSTDTVGVEMIEGFGGAVFDEAASSYTFPAGSEVWAGFANLNVDIYPFTFANGGTITFTAAVAAGGADTNVYFRFERLPFPDVDPSFNLDPVLIVGETEMEYSITIPAQDAANTYESFLLYVVEQDQTVIIKDIVVTDDGGSSAGGGTTDGGTTDGGTTDGGATDGSTDGGATDGGSTDTVGVEMIEGFGGAVFDEAASSYTFPAGSEVWAGFANLNVDIYPFTFANGGTITFTAAVPAGGADTSVYFRFERLPHPDVDPAFNLDPVLVVGETEMEYTVTIPAQAAGTTYSSFLMYVVDQDQPVMVKDIVVTDDNGSTAGGTTGGGATDGGSTDGGATDGSAQQAPFVEMIEGFGGAVVDGVNFTYPSGAEVWAGFANLNTDIYPFTFDNGGTITFMAAVPPGGADTSIYFRFERLPHPDVDPAFNLDPVLIVGSDMQEYTVTIPAQAAGTTYSSFLMYVVDQDQLVAVTNIVVSDDNGTTGTPAP